MKIAMIFLLALFCVEVEAKVKIKSIKLNKNKSMGEIIINTKGIMQSTPELYIKGNIVQVSVPKSFVWPKIDRKVGLSKSFDTTLMAYQYDKNVVRVRAVLPYSVKGYENKVSLMLEDNKVILNFPILKTKKITAKNNSSAYDEKYLDELLSDKNNQIKKVAFKKKAPIKAAKKINKKNIFNTATDKVSRLASSTMRSNTENGSKFSIWNYVLKFMGFLGIVLVAFYAVVLLMRKGVMRKGRLGFFNNSNLVEVLSTTHVGPKKSLLMIKAHKQVFLISSTDKGMEFLSEVNDAAGILKEGEKEVLGNNFDMSLAPEKELGRDFKLKEDLNTSKLFEKEASVQKNIDTRATSKYSEQIKKKLKGLKPLQ